MTQAAVVEVEEYIFQFQLFISLFKAVSPHGCFKTVQMEIDETGLRKETKKRIPI